MCSTGKFIFCFCITIFFFFLLCRSPDSTLSIFKPISAIFSLSLLLLKGLTYLLVFLFQALGTPAQGLHGSMSWVAAGIRSLATSLLNRALKEAISAASMAIGFLKELGPKFASAAYAVFDAALEQAKAWIVGSEP